MKKFIKRLVLFCVVMGGLLVPVELLLRKVPNNYRYKREYLDSHASRVKLLILGSSHAYYGVDPQYMPAGSFNAAYLSQDFEHDYRVFNKYYSQLDSLQTVVLPISYPSFFYTIMSGPEKWRHKNYLLYYRLYEKYDIASRLDILHVREPAVFRLYNYYIQNNKNVNCTPLGFGAQYIRGNHPLDIIAGAKKAALQQRAADFSKVEENRAYLQKIIDMVLAKKCRILLFTPPATAEYREQINQEQVNKMYALIAEMTTGKRDVIYADFMNDGDFTKEDYYDADHLNGSGAKKLTGKLVQLLSEK